MTGLSRIQTTTLTRAVILLGKYGDKLDAGIRETVQRAAEVFRKRGSAMTLGEAEWEQIQEAVGSMTALREQEPIDADV